MTLHIVGAGLAGLSSALTAAESGLDVVLHEGAGQAGGRARSWIEPTLDRLLDNGTHMVVGANHAVFDFLRRIGSTDQLIPGPTEFPILDLASGKISTANNLSTILSVVGALGTLGFCGADATIGDCLGQSAHFTRFWDPLAIAVMNTPSDQASASVFRRVAKRTLWRSQAASRPYLAREGLTQTFVRPALERLAALGVRTSVNHPLRRLSLQEGRAATLHFDDENIALDRADRVILAVPWAIAQGFLPQIPDLPSSPIVNGHFLLAEEPATLPDGGFLGLIGGTGQWLFRRGDVLSVTISAAGSVAEQSADQLAAVLWSDIQKALGLTTPPVAFRVIKEKRATLFHTPAVERLRPDSKAGDNLFLAGDWTATGLPCTLESAIASGTIAAGHAIRSIPHP